MIDALLRLLESEIPLNEDRVDWLRANRVVPEAEVAQWQALPAAERSPKVLPAEFEALLGVDPTPQKQYLEWLIRQTLKLSGAARQRFIGEDLTPLAADLKLFTRLKPRLPVEQRDLNRYKDALALATALEPYRAGDQLASKAEQAREIKSQSIRLLDQEPYLVLIPKTKEAAQFYGAGTRWCTAAENNNYFDQYNEDGPLFIIIQKQPPLGYNDWLSQQQSAKFSSRSLYDFLAKATPEELQAAYAEYKQQGGETKKWQLHFESNQFMDVRDVALDVHKFMAKHPPVAKAIADWVVQQQRDGWDNSWPTPTPHQSAKYLTQLGQEQRVFEFLSKDEFVKTKVLPEMALGLFATGELTLAQANTALLRCDLQLVDAQTVEIFTPGDYPDLVDLFDRSSRSFAKQVFDGDGYDGGYNSFSAEDALRELTSKQWKMVEAKARELELDFRLSEDDAEESDDIEALVGESTLDGWDSLRDAIHQAVDWAYTDAQNVALHEQYTDAVNGLLGVPHWTDSKLVFRKPLKKAVEELREYRELLEENNDTTDYSYVDLLRDYLAEKDDLISSNSFNQPSYVEIDDDNLTDHLQNQLGDL